MDFSEKIAMLRRQKNWSQEELAEKLMVTRQAVSKWESAQSMPDLDKIVQLSELLGVSTDYLLKDSMDEPTKDVPGQAAQAQMCARLTIIGVVLCILSAVPIFAVMCEAKPLDGHYTLAVCALLLLVGVACLLLVRAGSMRGAVDQLLEQGDYTRERKAKSRVIGAISAVYWLLVTAVFLFYTFAPSGNGQPQYSWCIWAIGGVLYGALMAGLSIYRKKHAYKVPPERRPLRRYFHVSGRISLKGTSSLRARLRQVLSPRQTGRRARALHGRKARWC